MTMGSLHGDGDCFNVEKLELFQTEPQGMDPGFGGHQL